MNPETSSKRPCISIIIPIWNAQAHLFSGLTSIRMQTLKDWECICVDDGSSDDSAKIVESFASKDSRYRLIRRQNAGPGMARNAGLAEAQGDYFSFVDADDMAHPEMLKRLLDMAVESQADLAVCGLFRFQSDNEFHLQVKCANAVKKEMRVYSAPLLTKMADWQTFRVHTWGKLYKRDVYGQLCFPDLRGSEDSYFTFDALALSCCAVFSGDPLYGYRIVDSGLTRSMARYQNYMAGDAEVALHGEEVLLKNGVAEEIRRQIVTPYIMRIYCYVNEMALDPGLIPAEKDELMTLAGQSLHRICRTLGKGPRSIPLIHVVSYLAVRLNSLRLLAGWNRMKRRIIRRNQMGNITRSCERGWEVSG
jgi:glycosyltransferase involved in cell wall biosynthesis